MDELSNQDRAVDLLQRLGLKEYESRVFVSLARLPQGTAKEISELSGVPRTRIYDAVRVLESKGLVETQHSNPQQFRAVSTDEAVNVLVSEYESRMETLRGTLQELPSAELDDGEEVTHEVWALSGTRGITERASQLVQNAESEIVLVVGSDTMFTDEVRDELEQASDRGIDVIVGTTDEGSQAGIQTALPDAEVFVSGLDWLASSSTIDDTTEIGRLLLVDRSIILVSTFREHESGETFDEHAVFGRGFDNGLVTIVRRLMASGLLPGADPGRGDD